WGGTGGGGVVVRGFEEGRQGRRGRDSVTKLWGGGLGIGQGGTASNFISERTRQVRRGFFPDRGHGSDLRLMSRRRWKMRAGRYRPVPCVLHLRRAGLWRRAEFWVHPGLFSAEAFTAASPAARLGFPPAT